MLSRPALLSKDQIAGQLVLSSTGNQTTTLLNPIVTPLNSSWTSCAVPMLHHLPSRTQTNHSSGSIQERTMDHSEQQSHHHHDSVLLHSLDGGRRSNRVLQLSMQSVETDESGCESDLRQALSKQKKHRRRT